MKFVTKNYLLIIGVIVFCLYVSTLAPSIVELDSGELATAQAVLGIAHPTGYPLFVLLGYIFIKMPLPLPPIYKSNLLAMLSTIVSILLFAANLKIILCNFEFFKKRNTNHHLKIIPEALQHFIIIIASLIFAFSKTVWLQSTSVEVYSLHLLLINLILFFFFKGLFSTGNKKFKINKYWVLFAVSLGLSFTNHLSTIYLLPGLTLIFLLEYELKPNILMSLSKLALITLLPIILLYGFMMFRASQNPPFNWGDPSTIKNLLYHITGMQYRSLAFSELNSPLNKLLYFFDSLSFRVLHYSSKCGEFGFSLLLIIFGIYYFWRNARKLLYMFIVFVLTVLLASINYNIYDLDAYFLLAYLSIAVLIFGGVIFILSFRNDKKFILSSSIIIFFFFIFQVFGNYNKVSEHNVFIYEDFTREVLKYTAPNAVIFCTSEDPFIATLYYHQIVLHERNDVLRIIPSFLKEAWYADWINHISPGTITKEGNKIKLNLNNRPLYISLGLYANDELLKNLGLSKKVLIPEYMFFRPASWDKYHPAINPETRLRLTGRRTKYTDTIEKYFLSMRFNRIKYEYYFGRIDQADRIIKNTEKIKWRVNIGNIL